MSWVAEKNATNTASKANRPKLLEGDNKPIAAILKANNSCVISIHPLRLPKKGGAYLSITGAHKNFKVYAEPIKVKKPILCSETSSRVAHACRVPPVSANGKPLANPKTNNGKTLLLP